MQLLTDSTRIKQSIVEALSQRVVSDATGVSDPPLTRYEGPAPSSRFWLGLLGPEASVSVPSTPGSLAERITPSAQGFSFRSGDFPLELEITASFALWITLHPTLDEQRRGAGLDETDNDDRDGSGVSGNGTGEGQDLARVRTGHLERQLEEIDRLGSLYKTGGLVFANETGGIINPSNLRNRSFAKVLRCAGLPPDTRFHDLRHTCATLLLSRNVNVKVVSEMLGHATIAITLDTYSHVLPDMQEKAAKALEEALS